MISGLRLSYEYYDYHLMIIGIIVSIVSINYGLWIMTMIMII